MDLQKLLSITIATLSALGTLLLAMGERDPRPALVIWVCAIASVAMTDFTAWFRLSRNLAGLIGLAVVVLYLNRLFRSDGEALLLVMAELLIWLQIILLFQKKDHRVYWELAVVSLLQVVVAAGFSQGVGFGLLLVVYMLVGLTAMTLLFLYREWTRYEASDEAPPAIAAAGRRWPLTPAKPEFASRPAGTSRSGIVGELFARLGLLGFGTMTLAVVIFFTVPRLGKPAWRGALPSAKQVVGFTDKVTLGSLGEVLESREEVMRLRLVNPVNGRPYMVDGDLYLRGAVLTQYHDNAWARPRGKRRGDPDEGRQGTTLGEELAILSTQYSVPRTRYAVPSSQIVLQHIAVEPLDREELFCVWPFTRPNDDNNSIYFEAQTGRLLRRSHLQGKRFSFQLNTWAFADGMQLLLVPCEEPLDGEALLQLPELPRLTALAGRWLTESGLPANDRVRRAQYLEQQLAESGQFQYSLEGQDRDLSIDAIEDFVSNNPRGHCEYFATALALMLRSQGIPSRVVIGYKCDEWNTAGNYYQVRQLHAHAWVEAYLEWQHVPDRLRETEGWERWRKGGWLRLDGTAPGSTGLAAASSTPWGRVRGHFDWIQSMWNDYIVEMDRQRQRETIYQPTLRALQNAGRALRDPLWWRGLAGRIGRALGLDRLTGLGGWLAAALAVVIVTGLSALIGWTAWRLGRRVWRRIAAIIARRNSRNRIRVEFYRRLEHLLARRGIVRSRGQTPLELARRAAAQLTAGTGRADLACLPEQVVAAFYLVRFGRGELDPAESQAIEQAIRQLELMPKSRS